MRIYCWIYSLTNLTILILIFKTYLTNSLASVSNAMFSIVRHTALSLSIVIKALRSLSLSLPESFRAERAHKALIHLLRKRSS